jgi:hypothetical protein
MAKKKTIAIKIAKKDLPKTRRSQAPTCRPHKNKARYDRKKGKTIDDLLRSRHVAGGVFYLHKNGWKRLDKIPFFW